PIPAFYTPGYTSAIGVTCKNCKYVVYKIFPDPDLKFNKQFPEPGTGNGVFHNLTNSSWNLEVGTWNWKRSFP
ncbi:MAG: hypothetical protein PVJ01_02150, partial [Pseudomonadota bacterium]